MPDRRGQYHDLGQIGIFEADKIFEGRLTDRDVRAALEYTVRAMRRGQLTLDNWQLDDGEGLNETGLVAWNIGCRWQELFKEGPRHSRDDLAGMLRRIMHSVDLWTARQSGGRGYLSFLAGQMRKMGISVQAVSARDVDNLYDPVESGAEHSVVVRPRSTI